MNCKNCGKEGTPIVFELMKISKDIDHFMGRINHGVSFHDNKAIQDWNNGNFGIKPLIRKIGSCCTNPEPKEVKNVRLTIKSK